MAVRVVFLGRLRDIAGEAQLDVPGPLEWDGLLEVVVEPLARELGDRRVHVACNGTVLPDKTALAACDGDEVALLPPVSGG